MEEGVVGVGFGGDKLARNLRLHSFTGIHICIITKKACMDLPIRYSIKKVVVHVNAVSQHD